MVTFFKLPSLLFPSDFSLSPVNYKPEFVFYIQSSQNSNTPSQDTKHNRSLLKASCCNANSFTRLYILKPKHLFWAQDRTDIFINQKQKFVTNYNVCFVLIHFDLSHAANSYCHCQQVYGYFKKWPSHFINILTKFIYLQVKQQFSFLGKLHLHIKYYLPISKSHILIIISFF